MRGRFQGNPIKRKVPAAVLTGILVLVLILTLDRCSGFGSKLPVLTVETPQKLSASQTDTF